MIVVVDDVGKGLICFFVWRFRIRMMGFVIFLERDMRMDEMVMKKGSGGMWSVMSVTRRRSR